MKENLMEKIVSLCKRRGFVFPGSEVYGGLANSWDYGPLGVELKNNIKNLWWKRFVQGRDDVAGIDGALIMNPKVWEASGHLKTFSDLLSECKACHNRIRVDQYLSMAEMERFSKLMQEATTTLRGIDPSEMEAKTKFIWKEIGEALTAHVACPVCKKKDWADARSFNLMMATYVGTSRDESNLAYLRPETAQAMFVDFKQVVDTTRRKIPFGIAQIGKAFRNEITPGNFIFRTREFEQMEIEYFIAPPKSDEDWQKHFEYWLGEMKSWMDAVGIRNYTPVEVPEADRAFYSKRTIDIEFEYPFGQKELYGLAYRTDFDLRNHFKDAPYRDQEAGEVFWPHVIEPTWGVDRTVLAVLCDAYTEEGERVYLKIKPSVAPYKAAIFPLLANKPELVAKAKEVYDNLRKDFMIAWDARGNIGKRYFAQDEIGTPYCITVDFDTLETGEVTVRDRDTATQTKLKIEELAGFLTEKVRG